MPRGPGAVPNAEKPRDRPRHRGRLGQQLVLRHHPVDQCDPGRFRGVHALAGEHHLGGLADPHDVDGGDDRLPHGAQRQDRRRDEVVL
jgi:hypothetical protein